ncbi:MAG: hypothetical protein JWL85_297 [Candidatus Saccharibacteria bacterium]|nr:hypothetical protein [Candidatus Saccharibacteria bacterium]
MMPPANPQGPYQQGYQNIPPTSLPPAGKSRRHIDIFLILFIITLVFFLSVAGFAAWAYMERGDYKNNSDKKVAAAIEIAKQETATEKDKEFVEKEKNPYKEYKGPGTFGSINVTYPKTWAAFVTEADKGSSPIDGYFHPSFVPGVNSGTQFALRVEVVNQQYSDVMKQFEGKVKTNKVKVTPYKAPKVPDVLGSRVEGEINTGQKDYMVLFPLRDKTIKISTESDRFVNDFNSIILPNLVFVP